MSIIREDLAEGVTLYCGDCREVLPSIGRVDAVVTDPPYGIGFKYESGKEATSTPEAFWSWFKPIHCACLARLKDGGFWAVWQSGTYHRYLWEWFGDDVRVYIAAKNFVQLRPTAINHAYDPVAIGYKNGAACLRPISPPRSLDYSVGNTASVVSDLSRLEKGHPTPKPLDQVEHLIENFVIEEGTILDPFCGSGTTGVAAAKLGRKFVGIEIEPKYFAIACSRIEETLRQPDLFITRSLPPKQEAML